MLQDAIQLIVKKAVEMALKGKKVDLQLCQCYTTICSEYYMKDALIGEPKEIADHMLKGIQSFDSYGNAEKMYASLCVYLNRILSKKEFHYYIDRLLRNIVANPELCTYVNVPVFKENVIKDFDPDKVHFKRTPVMVYCDYSTFQRLMKLRFENSEVITIHDKQAGDYEGKLIDPRLDFKKKIYVYTCDPNLHFQRLSQDNYELYPESQSVSVKLDQRCTVIFTNHILKLKTKKTS